MEINCGVLNTCSATRAFLTYIQHIGPVLKVILTVIT